jgi:hypothetical protein
MPRITENLVVNAAGGLFVDVTPTFPCRKMTIDEDPKNGANVGLQYKEASDGFVAIKNLEVGAQLVVGNTIAQSDKEGPVIGYPAQNSGGSAIAATVVLKLLSQGAATKYRKSEVE